MIQSINYRNSLTKKSEKHKTEEPKILNLLDQPGKSRLENKERHQKLQKLKYEINLKKNKHNGNKYLKMHKVQINNYFKIIKFSEKMSALIKINGNNLKDNQIWQKKEWQLANLIKKKSLTGKIVEKILRNLVNSMNS